MFSKLADSIANARNTWAVVTLLLVFGVGAGASSLRADFSLESFFGSGANAWGELTQYKEFWGPDDDKILIASGS